MSLSQSIKGRVMLASLSLSVWIGRRFDDRATGEVEANHHAKDIGRFNKRLLPKQAKSYDNVNAKARKARDIFERYTLAYDQMGVQLLSVDLYSELSQRMRQCGDDFSIATSEFYLDYPDLREAARAELNGLYREDDYPSLEHLKTKFGFRTSYLPFPDAEQFDVILPAAELAEVKAATVFAVDNAIKAANSDLMQRLFDSVTRLSSRLNAKAAGGRFHESAVRDLQNLLELAPKMNVSGDQKIATAIASAQAAFGRLTVEEVKASPTACLHHATQATDIAREISKSWGFDIEQMTRTEPVHAESETSGLSIPWGGLDRFDLLSALV